MAGFYPDVPDHRMALDKDGTQVFKVSAANVFTQCTPTEIATLNNEGNEGVVTNGQNDNGKLIVLFPEKRDLAACFINIGYGAFINGSLNLFETSVNSTNGIDGDWLTLSMSAVNQQTSPVYRTGIVLASRAGITGIRLSFASGAPSSGCSPTVHLYGTIAADENPNRLAMWHPTLDQSIGCADLDWGDVPRASIDNCQVRIKNLSSTLTANTITVSVDALTDTTPSVPAQHTLSIDGGAFGSTCAVETLAPGAISLTLTLRRTTPPNAALSLWAARISAIALSWL
jgi:hypothetical protein